MANFTASTGFSAFCAGNMLSSAPAQIKYFTTLHATGFTYTAATTYASSAINELATANGYTVGGLVATASAGTAANKVSFDNPTWTQSGGSDLVAQYCALWAFTGAGTTGVVGAKLIAVNDAGTKTASGGGTMAAGLAADQFVIATPA